MTSEKFTNSALALHLLFASSISTVIRMSISMNESITLVYIIHVYFSIIEFIFDFKIKFFFIL